MMNSAMLLIGLGHWEIIAILMLALLIFGGKKLPELARSVGKSISQFKKGIKEIEKDVDEAGEPPDESSQKQEDKPINKA